MTQQLQRADDDGYVYVRMSRRMADNINKVLVIAFLGLVGQAGFVWLTVHDMQAAVKLNTEARKIAITTRDFPLLTQSMRDRIEDLEEADDDQKDINKALFERLRQVETRIAGMLKSGDATWYPPEPWPPRPEHSSRVAYHKSPALGIMLVKDDPGA